MTASKGLLCGNLVYQAEKPKSEIEVAFLCLLSLFIKSITGLLFRTTHMSVKTCKKPRFILICLYFSKTLTINCYHNSD